MSGGQRNVQAELLAILRGNAHTFMTTADLELWVYGCDSYDEPRAGFRIRQAIWRLRLSGHQIRTRPATWEPPRLRVALAYQLVVEHAKESAA